MKNLLKRLLMLSLAVVMVLSMSTTALAADTRTITFTGATKPSFDFTPGSKYTSSDLFDNFKNVMPGDTLEQKVTIVHMASDCDYIKVYMRVEPHDAKKNPLTYDQDYAKSQGKQGETVATMQDFLSQLTMRIYNGTNPTPIYESSPDQAGALADNVLLGVVDKNQQVNLRVELDVPENLDNKYANRVGEMDWVFYANGFNYKTVTVEKHWDDGGDKYGKRTSSVEVQLYQNGDALDEPVKLDKSNKWSYTWEELEGDSEYTVKEVKVPSGYHVSYKKEDVDANSYTWKVINSMKLIQTGQLNWPIPVLGSLGVLMLCVGIFLLKRKEQKNA